MDQNETIVFGIPVPSDNKVFLAIVVVHIVLGIVCVLSGLVAMLSRKGGRIHSQAGKVYYCFLLLVFVTVVPLSIMRWPYNNHLFVLGLFSFCSAYAGKKLVHAHKPGSTRWHTVLMGVSYILLLTAFYVDNGKNLPFWNQFAQLFFWLFPAVIGVPIIAYTLYRHPLNRTSSH